ncbi:MAG: hypothetical protein GC191_17865 [Azospirillum sp.]|nr:hypothetical protein [Azospirillum sp.]
MSEIIVRIPVDPASPLMASMTEAIALARDLIDLLARENAALAHRRLDAPAGYAEAKTRLIQAYEIKLEELAGATPSELQAEAAATALAELKAANLTLQAAAQSNAAALRGAIDANRQVLDIVVNAAKQRLPAQSGYGRQGGRTGVAAYKPVQSVMLTQRL